MPLRYDPQGFIAPFDRDERYSSCHECEGEGWYYENDWFTPRHPRMAKQQVIYCDTHLHEMPHVLPLCEKWGLLERFTHYRLRYLAMPSTHPEFRRKNPTTVQIIYFLILTHSIPRSYTKAPDTLIFYECKKFKDAAPSWYSDKTQVFFTRTEVNLFSPRLMIVPSICKVKPASDYLPVPCYDDPSTRYPESLRDHLDRIHFSGEARPILFD